MAFEALLAAAGEIDARNEARDIALSEALGVGDSYMGTLTDAPELGDPLVTVTVYKNKISNIYLSPGIAVSDAMPLSYAVSAAIYAAFNSYKQNLSVRQHIYTIELGYTSSYNPSRLTCPYAISFYEQWRDDRLGEGLPVTS